MGWGDGEGRGRGKREREEGRGKRESGVGGENVWRKFIHAIEKREGKAKKVNCVCGATLQLRVQARHKPPLPLPMTCIKGGPAELWSRSSYTQHMHESSFDSEVGGEIWQSIRCAVLET